MDQSSWIVLAYRVPAEPARGRMAVWRRLKSLGAVYLQGGVCLLPRTDEHLRALKLLENEIAGIAGECVLLETTALDAAQEQKVVARFRADRDEQYREFLGRCADFEAEIARETAAHHFSYAELEENDEDLKKLRSWLEKIRRLDFYPAPLGAEAAARFAACEALLDAYGQRVFDIQDENRASPSNDAKDSPA